MRRTPVVALALLATIAVGCGVLTPTPARFRPPLPPAEPMPELAVEDVVAELEAIGFACAFSVTEDMVDADGDPHSAWRCVRGDQDAGDYLTVGMTSDETGPIESVGAHRTIQIGRDRGPDPAVLDADAAAAFEETLFTLIVPEELRLNSDGILTGVQRNFPIELGDGWFVGFDRNQISRTMRVVYSTAGQLEGG